MVEDVGTEPVDHDAALIDIRTLHFLYPEIAVLCQRGGWQAITESALSALVDVKDRFTRNLAGRAARYADLAGRNEVAVPDFVVAYRDIVGADGLKDLRHYCESISQSTVIDSGLKEADFPFSSRTVSHADFRSMNTSVDSIDSTLSHSGSLSKDSDIASHFDTDIMWPPIGSSPQEVAPSKKAEDGTKAPSTPGSTLVIRADEEDDSELQMENSLPKRTHLTSLPVVALRQLKSFAIGPDGQVTFLKEPKVPSAKLPTETSPKKAPKPVQEPITVPADQPLVKYKKSKESRKKHVPDITVADHTEPSHRFVEDVPVINDNELWKIRTKPSSKKDKPPKSVEDSTGSSKRNSVHHIADIKGEQPDHPKSVKMTFPIPPEKPKLNIKFSKHNFELPHARDEVAVEQHHEKEKKAKSKRSDRDEDKETKKEIQRNKERQLEKELEMAVKTKRPSLDAPDVEVKKHKKGERSSEASPAYYHSQQESPRIVTPYHDVPAQTEERSKKSHKKRKERKHEEAPVPHNSKSMHGKAELQEEARSQKYHDGTLDEPTKKRSEHEALVASVLPTSPQVPSTFTGIPAVNPAIPKLKLKFGGKNLMRIADTPVKQEIPEPQPSPQSRSPRVVLPPVQAPIVPPAFPLDMSRKKSAPVPEFATSAPLDLSMSSRAPPPKEVKEPKQHQEPKEIAPPVKAQPVPVKKESKRSMGSHMPSRASMVGHTKEVKVPTPPPPIPGPIAIKDVKDVLAPIITDHVPLIKVIIQEQQQDKVWICPACKRPDDGVSEMVGCDGCDEWYHWVCVGLTSEPASDKWYCPKCLAKLMAKSKKPKRK